VRCSGDHPGGDRLILVNLGASLVRAVAAEPLLAPPTGTRWKMCWSSEDVRYGGRGTPAPFTHEQLSLPGHATVVCSPDTASVSPAAPLT
jgi:maltooligosyltrehalose trehalohydrolase